MHHLDTFGYQNKSNLHYDWRLCRVSKPIQVLLILKCHQLNSDFYWYAGRILLPMLSPFLKITSTITTEQVRLLSGSTWTLTPGFKRELISFKLTTISCSTWAHCRMFTLFPCPRYASLSSGCFNLTESLTYDHLQVLKWMKNPVRLSQLSNVLQCPTLNPTNCLARNCFYDGDASPGGKERFMKSCVSCPTVYPWVGNPLGQ